jgi:NADH-quinone oxidoreductase subunit C/D
MPLSSSCVSASVLRITYQPTVDHLPTVWVSREDLPRVLRFLRSCRNPTRCSTTSMGSTSDCARTAGLPAADFSVFYHLLSIERNSDVRIKVALSADDLRLPTATGVWPNANWYEREVWDLYGIVFDGHPHLQRIMMPRTWKGHPLRKDYPARATEFDPFMLDAAKAGSGAGGAAFRS